MEHKRQSNICIQHVLSPATAVKHIAIIPSWIIWLLPDYIHSFIHQFAQSKNTVTELYDKTVLAGQQGHNRDTNSNVDLKSVTITLYKRLCYCRGTARRATSVEILWPFFLTELLTRSSANPEEPCEHTVSWNRVRCCTNVRRIACENVCNRRMTFKVIQGHCRCHHLIGHILFPISLPL